MNELGPILDYASPRPRGRFRLPSSSRLQIVRDRDCLTVTETLDAKWGAIGGLIVGVLTLVVLGILAVAGITEIVLHGFAKDLPVLAVFQFIIVGLWVTEFVVMLMVINNTWRRTLLRAIDGELSLEFRAPFGNKRYAWPFDQIVEIGIDRTQEPGFLDPRRELTFRAAGGQMVRLFTDHSDAELTSILEGLEGVMAIRGYRRATAC